MKVHELKCWHDEMREIRLGDKTHEVRVNDRDFKVGDVLHLREWYPQRKKYTGDEVLVRVTNITEGGTYGLPFNVCCMSIKVLAWQIHN